MAKRNTDKNTEGAEAQADAPTEQAEAPTEPQTEKPAQTDEEKAAAKATREAEAAQAEADLKSVIDTAISGAGGDGALQDEHSEALQLAYRKIPAASRGRVQAEILRDKMTQDGVNMTAVAAVLEVMTKAPASKPKSTRVAKPARPAEEVVAEGLTVLALAQRTLLDTLTTDELKSAAREASKAALNGEIADEAERETLLSRVARVVRSASPKGKSTAGSGGGGDRITMQDNLSDVFGRGDLVTGTVIQHGDFNGTINAEGKIEAAAEGSPFDSPSAAASALLKAAGKSPQVNGWSWWNVSQGDGKSVTLGSLRKQ